MRHSWWGIALVVALVGTVYFLDAVLMPFIAGLILAYLADPLTDYFQRLGMRRTWAVSSVFLVLMFVLALSLLILIPLVVQQIKQLGEALPGVLNWVESVLAPQVQEWTGYDLATELGNVRETLIENWRDAGSYVAQALGQIGRSGMAFVSWVTYVALIPVVTFYLLLDWDRMLDNLGNLVPRQWADDTFRLARRCDEVLAVSGVHDEVYGAGCGPASLRSIQQRFPPLRFGPLKDAPILLCRSLVQCPECRYIQFTIRGQCHATDVVALAQAHVLPIGTPVGAAIDADSRIARA